MIRSPKEHQDCTECIIARVWSTVNVAFSAQVGCEEITSNVAAVSPFR